MSDPQVRQLAERCRKRVYDLWVQSRKSSRTDFGQASFQNFVRDALCEELAAFASHTRREALREAANLTERSTRHKGCKDCEKCLVLKQAATAIRLLAEEEK